MRLTTASFASRRDVFLVRFFTAVFLSLSFTGWQIRFSRIRQETATLTFNYGWDTSQQVLQRYEVKRPKVFDGQPFTNAVDVQLPRVALLIAKQQHESVYSLCVIFEKAVAQFDDLLSDRRSGRCEPAPAAGTSPRVAQRGRVVSS